MNFDRKEVQEPEPQPEYFAFSMMRKVHCRGAGGAGGGERAAMA